MTINYVFAEGQYPTPQYEIGDPTPRYDSVQVTNTFGQHRFMQPIEEVEDRAWRCSSQGETFIVHPPENAWEGDG